MHCGAKYYAALPPIFPVIDSFLALIYHVEGSGKSPRDENLANQKRASVAACEMCDSKQFGWWHPCMFTPQYCSLADARHCRSPHRTLLAQPLNVSLSLYTCTIIKLKSGWLYTLLLRYARANSSHPTFNEAKLLKKQTL